MPRESMVGYVNVGQCKYCPRNHEEQHKGEWYWANIECDCCSTCWEADRSRVKVHKDRYTRTPGSSTDINGKKLNITGRSNTKGI